MIKNLFYFHLFYLLLIRALSTTYILLYISNIFHCLLIMTCYGNPLYLCTQVTTNVPKVTLFSLVRKFSTRPISTSRCSFVVPLAYHVKRLWAPKDRSIHRKPRSRSQLRTDNKRSSDRSDRSVYLVSIWVQADRNGDNTSQSTTAYILDTATSIAGCEHPQKRKYDDKRCHRGHKWKQNRNDAERCHHRWHISYKSRHSISNVCAVLQAILRCQVYVRLTP